MSNSMQIIARFFFKLSDRAFHGISKVGSFVDVCWKLEIINIGHT